MSRNGANRRVAAVGAAALLLGACLRGQTPARHVEQLQSEDPVTAEIARRSLCQLKRGALPADAVAALLRSARPRVRADAASVLHHHDVCREQLRRLLDGPGTAAGRQVLSLAGKDQLQRIAVKGQGPIRVEALGLLQDRGQLDDALLARAIRSDDAMLSETACRILVLERSPFPLPVAEAAIDAPARGVLLELLAVRPRLGAGPWLLRLLDQHELSPKDRILAIQALPGSWMNKRFAREVVAAAGGPLSLGFGSRIAASRFPPDLADSMVPVVVEQIRSGSRARDVLPCLVRMTPAGERQLLQQGEKLGRVAAGEICAWLAARRSQAVEERIVAALAGKSKLDSYLLRLTGPHLETPGQVARVVQFLEGDDDKLRVLAFDELLEARVYHESMLEFVLEAGERDRVRRAFRLLNLPREVLPEEAFLELLAAQTDVVVRACQLLAAGGLSRDIEERLLELAAEDNIPAVRRAAQHTLLAAGSEAAGTRVWNDMSLQARRSHAIDWLIRRPRLWTRELLLKERQALEDSREDRTGGRYYHRVLLALAALGDRGAAEQLLRVVHRMDPDLLRRSKKALLERLTGEQARRLRKLLSGAGGRLGERQRVELLEWVAARPGLVSGLEDLLRRLWKKDPSYEVRLAALRGLLRGPGAGDLYQEVTGMLARPLDEEQEEVVLEMVGSFPLPLSHEAMDFLARVVLLAPLADPRAEVRRSMVVGWDGTRREYPMLRPVANLLRRDEKARPGQAFRAVAEGLPAAFVNRRRLGLFLSLVAIREPLFRDLGPVLARAIVGAVDRSREFLGPAHLVLAQAAERDGDDASAARHYRIAGSHMLRRPLPRFLERAFLGEADPLMDYHPLADLAARPHLCDARVLMTGKDRSGARKALTKARDLALGDKQAMDEVARLEKALKENPR